MNEKLTTSEITQLQSEGYFRLADAQPTLSPNNFGLPASLLTSISFQAARNILAKRTAEQMAGSRRAMLDWADEEFNAPYIETTGQTQPYGDYNLPVAASFNTSFNKHGHYRFHAYIKVGDLQQAQYAKAKMDAREIITNAATEALAVEFNRAAMFGYADNSSNQFLIYGLLNNPSLANYENAPKPFNQMTWEEVIAFFAAAVGKLTIQTGNHIDRESKIRVAIASSSYSVLNGLITPFNVSAMKALQDMYPNMEFVSAVELEKANQNQNVCYFIGESELGGVSTTAELGFSEMAKMSNVVNYENFTSQTIACGTIGAVIYKPAFIVRYTNI